MCSSISDWRIFSGRCSGIQKQKQKRQTSKSKMQLRRTNQKKENANVASIVTVDARKRRKARGRSMRMLVGRFQKRLKIMDHIMVKFYFSVIHAKNSWFSTVTMTPSIWQSCRYGRFSCSRFWVRSPLLLGSEVVVFVATAGLLGNTAVSVAVAERQQWPQIKRCTGSNRQWCVNPTIR